MSHIVQQTGQSSKHTNTSIRHQRPRNTQQPPSHQERSASFKIITNSQLPRPRTNSETLIPSPPPPTPFKRIGMSTPFRQSKYKTWQCHLCDNETKYNFQKQKNCPIHSAHKVTDCKKCKLYPPPPKRHSYSLEDDEDDEPPSPSISNDTIGFANTVVATMGTENEKNELLLPTTYSSPEFEKEGRRHSILGSKEDKGANKH